MRMRAQRQWVWSALAVAFGAYVVAGADQAAASLWLVFEPPAAAQGTPVRAHTVGAGAISVVEPGSSMQVFLVGLSIADQVSSPDDSRLVPVGNLVADTEGNGSLEFIVPNLPPGEYMSMVWCEPCAQFSAGRSLLPAGTLRVLKRPESPGLSGSSQGIQPVGGRPDGATSEAIAFILRVTVGLICLWAAFAKIRAPRQFMAGVRQYGLLPAQIVRPVAAAVVLLEAASAVLLLGVDPIAGSAAASFLFLVFSAAIGINYARRRDVPCHCFGSDSDERISVATLGRALFLLAMSLATLAVTLKLRPGIPPRSSILPSLTVVAGAITLVRVMPLLGRAWSWLTAPAPRPNLDSRRVSFKHQPLDIPLNHWSNAALVSSLAVHNETQEENSGYE